MALGETDFSKVAGFRAGASDDAKHATLGLIYWLSQFAPDESEADDRHAQPDSLPEARQIGQFRLEALLGTGAYGVVFRAYDDSRKAYVALKFPWPAVMFSHSASQRFVQEAKTGSVLDHPGIVRVLDYGWLDSVCYIALEYVEGPTLAQWLQDHKAVDPREAAEIVRQVALAIELAHQQGIIHRDLKPSNLLLRPNPDCSLGFDPLVSDFGLARRPGLSELSIATLTGAVVGTDFYMAPEQAAGDMLAGPASDIFSLGVILYEIVTGQKPFDGATSDVVRQRIQSCDPLPPRRLRAGVPKNLQTIILKCLEKSPDERYVSAAALATDLENFVAGRPIEARPISTWRKAKRLAKRKPVLVSISLLASVSGLLLLALLGGWTRDRMAQARKLATATASVEAAEARRQKVQYVGNMQQASRCLRLGRHADAAKFLDDCLELDRVKVGAEFQLLRKLARTDRIHIDAHADAIHTLDFSPSGDVIVSGGRDGRVIAWDSGSGSKLWELKDDGSEVNAACISPDGKLLAVTNEAGRIVVYRFSDRTIHWEKRLSASRALDLVWLGDARRLAVVGDGGLIFIINIASGESRELVIADQSGQRAEGVADLRQLVYLAKRNAIAARDFSGRISIVDIPSATAVDVWGADRPLGYETMCCVPSMPECLACYTRGQEEIQLLRTSDGKVVGRAEAYRSAVSLCYSPDCQALLAIEYPTGTISVYSPAALLSGVRTRASKIGGEGNGSRLMAVSRVGNRLASCAKNGKLTLYDSDELVQPLDFDCVASPAVVKYSPCGRWLGVSECGSFPRRFSLLEARSGRKLWSIEHPAETAEKVNDSHSIFDFSPSGDRVFVWDAAAGFACRDVLTGRVVTRFEVPGKIASPPILGSVQFMPDGKRLILYLSEHVCIYDAHSGALIADSTSMTRRFLGCHACRMGNVFLEWDLSGTLVGREEMDGRIVLRLTGVPMRITKAVFSPDGGTLACIGDDKILYLYDLNQTTPKFRCFGAQDFFASLFFSLDGHTVAGVCVDGVILFWDPESGMEIARLGDEDWRIRDAEINRQGDQCVLGLDLRGRYGLRFFSLGDAKGAPVR